MKSIATFQELRLSNEKLQARHQDVVKEGEQVLASAEKAAAELASAESALK